MAIVLSAIVKADLQAIVQAEQPIQVLKSMLIPHLIPGLSYVG